ncbi:hypothetical protein QBC44DRAFT_363590 [Cladorrhinum sp. PSN332]|nr:hypothetical protein QBC44DRAFT_363590 [Cladorrhinum sp. PSN332]
MATPCLDIFVTSRPRRMTIWQDGRISHHNHRHGDSRDDDHHHPGNHNKHSHRINNRDSTNQNIPRTHNPFHPAKPNMFQHIQHDRPDNKFLVERRHGQDFHSHGPRLRRRRPPFLKLHASGVGPTALPETRRFEFSPAVCPEKWMMHYVRSVNPTLSTAHCCAPGFKYHHPTDIPGIFTSMGCFSDPRATPTSNIWDYQTPFGRGTMVAHNAWRVSWAESDLSTMSPPPPPDLALGAYDSWPTTTDSLTDTTNSGGGGGNFQSPSNNRSRGGSPVLFLVLVTVLPLLLILVAVCVGVSCWRKRKRMIAAANIVEGRAVTGRGEEGREVPEGIVMQSRGQIPRQEPAPIPRYA